MTTRTSHADRPSAVQRFWPLTLIGPALIFYVLFFAVPMATVLGNSFTAAEASGAATEGLTGRWYAEAFDSYYLTILARTLAVSAFATVIALLVGYFLAYVEVRVVRSAVGRRILLLVALTPLFTSAIVRAFGWLLILGRDGVLNDLLYRLGPLDRPLAMTYNTVGVVIGLTHVVVPFAYLSLAGTLRSQDRNLELASQDLGAGRLSTFLRIVVPLSTPGVVSAVSIGFTLAVSSYVVPAVLGGGKVKVLASLIYEQFMIDFNWGLGSVLAVVLFIPVLVILWAFGRLGRVLYSRGEARA